MDYKEDDSPVTEADKTSNELIVQGLKDEYPQIPVLAEESADDLSRLSKEYCFIVDPWMEPRSLSKAVSLRST